MRKGNCKMNYAVSYLILELESKTKHGYLGRNAKIKLN